MTTMTEVHDGVIIRRTDWPQVCEGWTARGRRCLIDGLWRVERDAGAEHFPGNYCHRHAVQKAREHARELAS